MNHVHNLSLSLFHLQYRFKCFIDTNSRSNFHKKWLCASSSFTIVSYNEQWHLHTYSCEYQQINISVCMRVTMDALSVITKHRAPFYFYRKGIFWVVKRLGYSQLVARLFSISLPLHIHLIFNSM